MTIEVTAYGIAKRFIGLKEIAGKTDSPAILAMLTLDDSWPNSDEVPWCAAFVNYICWLLTLARPKIERLAARSWLSVGESIPWGQAVPGFDIVIVTRGEGVQPGVDAKGAAGHVGFFGGFTSDKKRVLILGGNQGDKVCEVFFMADTILDIRRVLQVPTTT